MIKNYQIHNQFLVKSKRKELRNNMPRAEYLLWQKLKSSQLNPYKFRRQHSVGRYIVDFYCPRLKLAIEIDGDTHLLPGRETYDQNRQNFIESLGIKVLRFSNNDVYESIEGVVEAIGEYASSLNTTP